MRDRRAARYVARARAPALYLDSNDISRFAAGRPEYLTIERCILDAVRDGVIACRFSAVHVEEALHIAPEHRHHALLRAETIVRLCGRSCLLYWHDLLVAEPLALMDGAPLARQAVHRDDGLWIPVPDLDPAELEAGMREEREKVRHEIKALLVQRGLPRQQRRQLERKAMTGRLPTSPVRGQPLPMDDLPEGLRQSMGGTAGANLLDLAFGRGSPARVARDVKALVLDLPAFFGHHFDGYPVLQEQFRMLRRVGATIRETLEQARPAAAKAVGIDKAVIHAMVDELTKEFVTNTRARLVAGFRGSAGEGIGARGLRDDAWDERVVRSPLGSLPALDTLVQAMASHLRRSMMPGATRKLLDSDIADMVHALYLPYVDAFRCDANTFQVLSPIAARQGVALLSRLEEVPGWIQAQREARDRGTGS